MLGDISAKYESGNKGYGAISSGRGDPGGASYGKYQLSSSTGTLHSFLNDEGYSDEFQGMTPGTSAFNNKWAQLSSDPKFGQAQEDYITRTHFNPAMNYWSNNQLPNTDKTKEAVFSAAVQHGKVDHIIDMTNNALKQVPQADESTVLATMYAERNRYVQGLSSLSAQEKQALSNRYRQELQDVLNMK